MPGKARACTCKKSSKAVKTTQMKLISRAQTKCGDTRGVPTRWNWCPSTCPSSQSIPPFMIFKVLQEGGSFCVSPSIRIQFMQDKSRRKVCSVPTGIVTQKTNVCCKDDEFHTVYRVANPRTTQKNEVIKLNRMIANSTSPEKGSKEFGTSSSM